MSPEWLAVSGLAAFVAAGTGALVWMVMHLHLQLAVLREREAHWRAALAAPAANRPVVSDEWIEARLTNALLQFAEQRMPALPAPEPVVIEPAARRPRKRPACPAPKAGHAAKPKRAIPAGPALSVADDPAPSAAQPEKRRRRMAV